MNSLRYPFACRSITTLTKIYCTCGTLVVSQTVSEKVYVCLSICLSVGLSVCPRVCLHQGHSMVAYGQTSLDTATPMPHESGRSPRGGDRHGPNHTLSSALCVELSELTSSIPNGVTGRAAVIARPRPAANLFISSIFKWNRLDEIIFSTALRAISSVAVAKAFLHPSLLPASLPPSLSSLSPPSLPPSFPEAFYDRGPF